jgi:NADH-quinone oxidoreductase subunit N
MSNTELVALLPLISFATVITIVLLAIPFWRNLKGICALSVVGLLISLATILWTTRIVPIQVTPLVLIDQYALLFMTLICLATVAVALLAYDYLKDREGQQEEFYLLLLLAALGAIVLVCSSHFASFLLGLELLGISLYALISFPIRGQATLEAALKYLILSGVASAFLLFGTALIFAALGTLSFNEMVQGFYVDVGSNRLYVMVGSALMLAGICFKLSLVPFHMWTPDVYEGAPAPVTAFVATVSKGAIFAILLRFFIWTDAYQYESILFGLGIIAVLSMLAGNLLALMQSSVKRILAYSSIAHLGYLLVAFIAGRLAGGAALAVEAASYFLVAYFITTLGAFGVVSIMSNGNRERDLDDIASYEGLFSRRPFLATAFTAMLLSLAGIPLTVGFVGKFYIFAAGVQGALASYGWSLLVALIIGSGIGLYYYLRIVFAMTKRPAATDSAATEWITIPVAGGWVMLTLTGTLLALGVYPTPLIELINSMVRSLPL